MTVKASKNGIPVVKEKHIQPIIDALTAVENHGFSRYEVFTDWIDLMLYTLENDEEAYQELFEKYDEEGLVNDHPIESYGKAFGRLLSGMEQTNTELLGTVYETLGMDNENFGQYFTPHTVCHAKAQIMAPIGDDSEEIEEPYTVADPASGSGRLLVESARAFPDDIDMVFYAKDKSKICAKMSALNMCFFNMDGYAVHGDSLRVTQNNVWMTQGSGMGGEISSLNEDEFPNLI